MENLFKVYDRVVAETMWFIMNHSKEKNNGRVVVEVNPNEPSPVNTPELTRTAFKPSMPLKLCG